MYDSVISNTAHNLTQQRMIRPSTYGGRGGNNTAKTIGKDYTAYNDNI